MPRDWKALSDGINLHIQAANMAEAKRELDRLRETAIPKPWRRTLASLARRAGDSELALRWLRPLVRSAGAKPAAATAEEKVEYAACLTRLGATDEARNLLSAISVDKCPRAAFERAALLVSEWNYRDSLDPLKAYVAAKAVTGYEKIVGKVNIAAALLHVRDFRAANALLRQLLHDTSVRRNQLLMGHVYHLVTQIALAQNDLGRAAEFLERSEGLLEKAREVDHFMLKKWRAFLSVLEGKADRARVAALAGEAERHGHWEIVRDCDRFLATRFDDEALFLKVYFGTSYPAYRETLMKEVPRRFRLPDELVWGPRAASADKILDLRIDETRAGKAALSPVRYRALLAFASDLYRPLRVGALFQRIHPDESFQPSSPNRVYRFVHLLREWLEQHASGITVKESEGEFRLHVAAGWGIRVSRGAGGSVDADSLRLKKMKREFDQRQFTSKDVAGCLGISQRNALRVLAEGLERKVLVKVGKRRAAGYRFG